MMTSMTPNPVARLIGAIILLCLIVTAPVRAFDDYTYDFSVRAPKDAQNHDWAVLPAYIVPGGKFRFGWTSKEWVTAKNTFGASIAVVVYEYDKAYSAKELLDKNITMIEGVKYGSKDTQQAGVPKSLNMKVLGHSLFSSGGKEGFTLDVVGSGTGFAIGVPYTSDIYKGAKSLKYRRVITHQRWYCIVRGSQAIVVLSTCPEKLFAKYAPTFKATEATLKVR